MIKELLHPLRGENCKFHWSTTHLFATAESAQEGQPFLGARCRLGSCFHREHKGFQLPSRSCSSRGQEGLPPNHDWAHKWPMTFHSSHQTMSPSWTPGRWPARPRESELACLLLLTFCIDSTWRLLVLLTFCIWSLLFA